VTEGDTKYHTHIKTCSSTYHAENLNLAKNIGERKRYYVYIKAHTHIFKEQYTRYLLSKYAKLSIHTHKKSLLSAELEQTLFGLHDTKMTQENLPLKKQICFHEGSPK